MATNSDASYKYAFSEEQREQLKIWGRRAAVLGIEADYLAALPAIHHQLRTEPLTWGDPCYDLNYLGLRVYQRACPPLHITYAVDSGRRLVYIKKIAPFTGSGLDQEG